MAAQASGGGGGGAGEAARWRTSKKVRNSTGKPFVSCAGVVEAFFSITCARTRPGVRRTAPSATRVPRTCLPILQVGFPGLDALPGQLPAHEIDQEVADGLQVVAPALLPRVRSDAGVAHRARDAAIVLRTVEQGRRRAGASYRRVSRQADPAPSPHPAAPTSLLFLYAMCAWVTGFRYRLESPKSGGGARAGRPAGPWTRHVDCVPIA